MLKKHAACFSFCLRVPTISLHLATSPAETAVQDVDQYFTICPWGFFLTPRWCNSPQGTPGRFVSKKSKEGRQYRARGPGEAFESAPDEWYYG